jgi:hypothetical protein
MNSKAIDCADALEVRDLDLSRLIFGSAWIQLWGS